VTIEQVMQKIWPFYALMFAVLMCVTYLSGGFALAAAARAAVISQWPPRCHPIGSCMRESRAQPR
jgi:hypothetical protein